MFPEGLIPQHENGYGPGLFRGFSDDGGVKMVPSNTEVGIEAKFKRAVYPRLVYPANLIRALHVAAREHVAIGACASLSNLQRTYLEQRHRRMRILGNRSRNDYRLEFANVVFDTMNIYDSVDDKN